MVVADSSSAAVMALAAVLAGLVVTVFAGASSDFGAASSGFWRSV